MTMTSSDNPWSNIPTAREGQFARRRVDANTNYALFWFRDEYSHPGLLIEISPTISVASLKQAKINIRDISVDVLDILDQGIRALTVKLKDSHNLDVFLKLCLDLIDRVTQSDNSEATFFMICRRLKQWQSLFSGKSNGLLSAKEIRGLFAELCFIAEILEKDSSLETAVINGWTGPEKTQHDFVLNDTAIEVKSIAGNERGKVRISSEDQLYTHLDELYLQVYLLAEIRDQTDGESLNGIVESIGRRLKDSANKNLFELKLHAARYIDIPEYDTPRFRVKDCMVYQVTEDFPRITRQVLQDGIESVSYDLILTSIDKFRAKTAIVGV